MELLIELFLCFKGALVLQKDLLVAHRTMCTTLAANIL